MKGLVDEGERGTVSGEGRKARPVFPAPLTT
jgi:hypothetical protein